MASVSLHAGEESPSWRLSAQTAADSVESRPRLPETVRCCQGLPEAASLDRKPVDRLEPASPRFLPCETQRRAATLQDVQPEKGPVDLRLGADQSLDSRLTRVA